MRWAFSSYQLHVKGAMESNELAMGYMLVVTVRNHAVSLSPHSLLHRTLCTGGPAAQSMHVPTVDMFLLAAALHTHEERRNNRQQNASRPSTVPTSRLYAVRAR